MFIECTNTFYSDTNTGIQRVVRNIIRHGPETAAALGYTVVPVILDNNRLFCVPAEQLLADKTRIATATTLSAAPLDPHHPQYRPFSRLRATPRRVWRSALKLLTGLLPFDSAERFILAPPDRVGLAWSILLPLRAAGLRPWPPLHPAQAGRIGLDHYEDCKGCVLLLLDTSWTILIWSAVERFKARGGSVVAVIYDLVPITHPFTCEPRLTRTFTAWLNATLRHADAFVCVSGSTAAALRHYADRTLTGRSDDTWTKPVAHFHLASNLDFSRSDDPLDPTLARIFTPDRHVFVMVGSFEPRKRHDYVLDAFDAFWQRGGTATLMLIGRQAWKTEAFLKRVGRHPQLGAQLFILRNVNDSDLKYAYSNASALVIASEIEGFGLPVVEAFQHGLPVLCSNIPVFQEIAGGRAVFFDLADTRSLTDTVEDFCRTHDSRHRSARTPQPWIDWAESTAELFVAITAILAAATPAITASPETPG